MKIGITGGSTLIELGDYDEVAGFFSRLREVSAKREADFSLISDRLFRRYLRSEELIAASGILEEVIRLLEPTENSKERAFSDRFKKAFQTCAESAVVNYEAFRDYKGYVYEPVRVVIADLAWYTLEMQRSLAEYESLSGAPFWARGVDIRK